MIWNARKPFAALLVIMAFASLATGALAKPASPKLEVGVSSHLWYLQPKQIDRLLTNAQSLGATHLRWDAHWKAVETQADQLAIPSTWDYAVDEAGRRGIASVLILGYGNKFHGGGRRPLSDAEISAYSRYAQFVVSHFKGRVKYFEIWNEWNEGNGGAGAGSASEYIKLLSQVYPAVKAIAPGAIFLVGGSSRSAMKSLSSERALMDTPNHSFLETAIKLGLLHYGDGLSIHPYTDTESDKAKGFVDLLHRVDRFARDNNRGAAYPIYVTEIGWTTTTAKTGRTVSEGQQADLLIAAIAAARRIRAVKMLTIYQLEDPVYAPDSAGDNYGLIDGKHRPKRAFARVKAFLANPNR